MIQWKKKLCDKEQAINAAGVCTLNRTKDWQKYFGIAGSKIFLYLTSSLIFFWSFVCCLNSHWDTYQTLNSLAQLKVLVQCYVVMNTSSYTQIFSVIECMRYRQCWNYKLSNTKSLSYNNINFNSVIGTFWHGLQLFDSCLKYTEIRFLCLLRYWNYFPLEMHAWKIIIFHNHYYIILYCQVRSTHSLLLKLDLFFRNTVSWLIANNI